MASKTVFPSSAPGQLPPPANTVNAAGGISYEMGVEHALCQLASTGTFNDGFYESGASQAAKLIELAAKVPVEFLARLAIYSRKVARMKDMPAFLMCLIVARDPAIAHRVFPRVINDVKMLRNFFQIMRSGVTGRKSLGSAARDMIQMFLLERSPEELFRQSVGSAPSLADIIKCSRIKPGTDERRAIHGYLMGKEHNVELLPEVVRSYEAFKKEPGREVPDVPWEMLAGLQLDAGHWCDIARNASWQQTRMNLNTFLRHGVFESPGMTALIAQKLKDRHKVLQAKAFPYQLYSAFKHIESGVPVQIANALQDAAEVATENVPSIEGSLVIAIDVSGSMSSTPVTGFRKGSSSKITSLEVAALITACLLRQNESARVIPFDTRPYEAKLNPRDSIMTLTRQLSINGGGTDCSIPLRVLNAEQAKIETLVMVSDNESWAGYGGIRQSTGMQAEWNRLKSRCKHARMACIDLAANSTTQAVNSKDVLNIGGFSDAVFATLSEFSKGADATTLWHTEVTKIEI